MAQRHVFRPGSWLRVCDITGFTVYAEDTRKQWNNYIVRKKSFEERNAQDFVRGVRDSQIVPDPRPRSTFIYSGEQTTLAATALIRSTILYLTAPIGLVSGNPVSVMMDDGNVFLSTVVPTMGDFSADFSLDFSVGGPLIVTLAQPLPFQASSGNEVLNTTYVAVQGQNYPRES